MSIADYAENAILDALFNNQSLAVTQAYLGLHTADPGEDGNNAEVSGGGYGRQAVSFGGAIGGVVSIDATVVFPTAIADWGSISHVSLWDAASDGNCLWVGPLTATKNIAAGITFELQALDITLD